MVVCVWSPGGGRPRRCPDHPTALPARRLTRRPSPSQPVPQQSGKPPQSPGRPGLPQRRSTPRRAAGYLERRRAWRMGPRGDRGPRRGGWWTRGAATRCPQDGQLPGRAALTARGRLHTAVGASQPQKVSRRVFLFFFIIDFSSFFFH